jgi:hypothetical protein
MKYGFSNLPLLVRYVCRDVSQSAKTRMKMTTLTTTKSEGLFCTQLTYILNEAMRLDDVAALGLQAVRLSYQKLSMLRGHSLSVVLIDYG